MRVLVVAVGKVKGPLAAVVGEYERRAARYWKLTVEEVAAGARRGPRDPEAVMTAEAEHLLAHSPGAALEGAAWRGSHRVGVYHVALASAFPIPATYWAFDR